MRSSPRRSPHRSPRPSIGEPVAAFLEHVLYRATASDWDGSQVVGENLTLAVTGATPTIVEGRISLNGGMLSATVDFDLTGSTVIIVQKSAS